MFQDRMKATKLACSPHTNSTWKATRCDAGAFTLVELLVCIAIIAILAAILLPVLDKAQLKSKTTVCINNLHQVGLAVPMYASDNSDEMVFCNWDGGGETLNGSPLLGWLYTRQSDNGAGTPGAPYPGMYTAGGKLPNNATSAYSTGALWDYVKNIKAYWCPMMTDTNPGSPYFNNFMNPDAGFNVLSSYVMNGGVNNYYGMRDNPPGPMFYKMSNVAFKGTCVLLWEPDENQPLAFNDGAAAADPNDDGMPSRRHITGSVLEHIGGSADYGNYNVITNQMNAPGPNDWWYAPYYSDGGYTETVNYNYN
jgi:prepilin-type N-terminal cleavage/methylation domain-containing protein